MNMIDTTIIEIEYKKDQVSRGISLAQQFGVKFEIRGYHSDGLVTLRFTGLLDKLEQLLEIEKPGDEIEAYFIV